MLIVLTEMNHWEHERWSYILDADLQGAEVLNNLFLFCEMANKETAKIKDGVQGNSLFAASSYRLRFYDRYETHPKEGYPVLYYGKRSIHMNGRPNYKSGGLMLEQQISKKHIYSALVALRERHENILYEDFEKVFLKRKGAGSDTL